MTPANPSRRSTRSRRKRHRTDLLATRIGRPAARRTRSSALRSKATRSTTARGASSCLVAASRRTRNDSSDTTQQYDHQGHHTAAPTRRRPGWAQAHTSPRVCLPKKVLAKAPKMPSSKTPAPSRRSARPARTPRRETQKESPLSEGDRHSRDPSTAAGRSPLTCGNSSRTRDAQPPPESRGRPALPVYQLVPTKQDPSPELWITRRPVDNSPTRAGVTPPLG